MTLPPASALHEAGDSPYFRVQAHAGPQSHCGPQAQPASWAACCVAGLWQPQAQSRPGQSVQRQRVGVGVVAFMVFLLLLKMRCQCRIASPLRIERNG